MKQHTPGPLNIHKCEPNGNFSVYASGPLAYIEKESDARLIASAPDLLAVLSAIVSDYHALQRSQGASASLGAEFTAGEWLGSRLGGHIARAESAISKAKGEA